jgi:HK97 family phage major capsid protein
MLNNKNIAKYDNIISYAIKEVKQMKSQEIEEKKRELAEMISNAKTSDELEELRKQVDEIKAVVPDDEETEATKADENNEDAKQEDAKQQVSCSCNEERDLIRIGAEEIVPVGNLKEERKMTNQKYSAETRAWAKRCLGRNDFDEEEKRALGDAVTTTATTFTASTAEAQGVNNGGLFIPKEVRMELMERIDEMSPFFRDIRKISVNGNVDLPYLYAGDDANWYAELTCTVNEGNEYKALQLTGWELAKDVVLTWKVEDMSVESFVTFVIEELVHKMGTALINAVIYGTGSSQPTGAIYGATAVTTGDTPIDTIVNTYASLSEEFRRGAKVYVSTAVKMAMVGYKDQNGNYPFLQGINGTDLFAIETEPFLTNNDIIVGNPRRYILNEVTPLRVDWERTVKCRQTRYGAYGIYDGKPQPNAFAKGQYTPAVSA